MSAPLRGGGGGRRSNPPERRQAAGPAWRAAEQPFENVAQVDALGPGHVLEVARVEALRPASAAAAALAAKASASAAHAEGHCRVALGIDLAAVELRSLGLVGQQVIGLGHVGEALRRLGFVLVAVGVQFLGELAIRGLDVLLVRVAGNAQSCIGIGHAC